MIFRKTQKGETHQHKLLIEQESCFQIRHQIIGALFPDSSVNVRNLRFRWNDTNIIDFKTPLIELITDQDAIIDCYIFENGNVMVQSVFETEEQVEIQFDNSEKVIILKESIAKKYRYENDKFALFLEYDFLNEEDYIYQYKIKHHTAIKYMLFDKIENFDKLNRQISIGTYSSSFDATINSTEVITIKQYKPGPPLQSVESYKPMIREIVSFNRFRMHPRFVQLKAFFMKDDEFFIGLEKMTGGSLHSFVENSKPLEEKTIALLSQNILDALNEMQKQGIYHGYLNSSNILLDGNNEAKISGFSLSRFFSRVTRSAMVESFIASRPPTYNFSAPEILTQENSGLKSDIWSFGAVLVEMVTGRMPFHHLRSEDIYPEIIRSGTIVFEMPLEKKNSPVKRMIDWCLKMNIDERPCAQDLLNEFSEYFDQHPVAVRETNN